MQFADIAKRVTDFTFFNSAKSYLSSFNKLPESTVLENCMQIPKILERNCMRYLINLRKFSKRALLLELFQKLICYPLECADNSKHTNFRKLPKVDNVLYQIRRPHGLAFVIYFWWLGELLLLYI
jgi:hypothetical protein